MSSWPYGPESFGYLADVKREGTSNVAMTKTKFLDNWRNVVWYLRNTKPVYF